MLHWRLATNQGQTGNISNIQAFLVPLSPLQVQDISLVCCSIKMLVAGPPPPCSLTNCAVNLVAARWLRRSVQIAAHISPQKSRRGWSCTVNRSWLPAPPQTVDQWWRWSPVSPPSWLMDTTSSCRPSMQCCSMSPPAVPAVTTSTLWQFSVRYPDWGSPSWLHLWTSPPTTGDRRQEAGGRRQH